MQHAFAFTCHGAHFVSSACVCACKHACAQRRNDVRCVPIVATGCINTNLYHRLCVRRVPQVHNFHRSCCIFALLERLVRYANKESDAGNSYGPIFDRGKQMSQKPEIFGTLNRKTLATRFQTHAHKGVGEQSACVFAASESCNTSSESSELFSSTRDTHSSPRHLHLTSFPRLLHGGFAFQAPFMISSLLHMHGNYPTSRHSTLEA
jgi:hypothetical protein